MPKEIRVLSVEGMSCGHCVSSIKNALGEINGIDSVNVDLEIKKVTIEYDIDKVTMDVIKGVIEDQGFDVK